MTEEQLAQRFARLAEEWRDQTACSSSTTDIVMNGAYQQIIGMGPAALPLILESLRKSPDHWFWALAAITGEDVAADTETMIEAQRRWLEWGVRQGLIEAQ